MQLAQARAMLGRLETAALDIDTTFNAALDLVRDCGTAYSQATPELRREWNQTFFDWLRVVPDGVVATERAEPFDLLLSSETVEHYDRDDRTGTWVPRTVDEFLAALEGTNEEPTPLFVGVGSNKNILVEVTGLEPVTSTLRT